VFLPRASELQQVPSGAGSAAACRVCERLSQRELRAASMALRSSGASGATLEPKRAITLPFLSARNFVKFQPTEPPVDGFKFLSVRNWYRGAWFLPLTDTFANMGNVTLYLMEQKVLISSLVPGSCQRKSLAGNPRTTSPLSLYFWYSASKPAYWGVKPQRLATLTMRVTLPLNRARGVGWPSMEFNVNSWMVEAAERDDASISNT